MRILFSRFLGLPLVALLSLVLVFSVAAQDKAPKKSKLSNIQGTVQMISKATSTITVQTTSSIKREVVYNADTKFLYGHSNKNTPGAVDQVKDGNFISCSGTFNAGKPQLMAQDCIYRETK
jgi:hypothetical protein